MNKALKFYLVTNCLKNIERTGWIYWNIPKKRLESIAEHIFGTCMLAIGIDSEYDLDIDINVVLKMLICHELEEIVIGDNTPFDSMTEEEKLDLGKKGVEVVLEDLIKKDEYIALLDEFNEGESKNAKFAFYCDKLECVLQANVYDSTLNVSVSGASPILLNDETIIKLREEGYNTVGDIFIEYDMRKRDYSQLPPFQEIIEELRKNNIGEVLKR